MSHIFKRLKRLESPGVYKVIILPVFAKMEHFSNYNIRMVEEIPFLYSQSRYPRLHNTTLQHYYTWFLFQVTWVLSELSKMQGFRMFCLISSKSKPVSARQNVFVCARL